MSSILKEDEQTNLENNFPEQIVETFQGKEEGPHFLILGGVHGNETCGIIALMALIQDLKNNGMTLERGTLTIMPIANPAAYTLKKRYKDFNLNRIIGETSNGIDAEYSYAQNIASLIDQADYVLDIHSFHTHGPAFVFEDYETPDIKAFANAAGLNSTVVGWPSIYGEATYNDTVGYAAKQGKTAILVECGQHDDPASLYVASKVVHNCLSYLKMIKERKVAYTREVQRIKVKDMVIKESKGHLYQNFQHLDPVEEGDIIALYKNGDSIKAPYDGYIIMPAHGANIGDEWFYFGQDAT